MTDTPRKGRKPLRPSGPMGRYLLSLDEDSMALARQIGSGNASLGVRMALAQWKPAGTLEYPPESA